ncbi:MAG: hypothetical protein ACHQ1D_05710 [Nitrososphaerales archaeon]
MNKKIVQEENSQRLEKTKNALMNSTMEIEQTTFLRALMRG